MIWPLSRSCWLIQRLELYLIFAAMFSCLWLMDRSHMFEIILREVWVM